jgi:hypothetical protein
MALAGYALDVGDDSRVAGFEAGPAELGESLGSVLEHSPPPSREEYGCSLTKKGFCAREADSCTTAVDEAPFSIQTTSHIIPHHSPLLLHLEL